MKFGLIGHPIDHSQSPALFREFCGGKYEYELIQGEDFEVSWKRFLSDCQAINITAPFKELAAARADIQAPEVMATGAANICVKTENGILALNSDCLAVKRILSENGISSGTALVIGFGGAGKAAAWACRESGLETLICNRNISKAGGIRPLEDIPSIAPNADIVIYTLPVAIPQLEALSACTVLEANYRNPVVASCRKYIPGTEWLKAQALEGYPLMIG